MIRFLLKNPSPVSVSAYDEVIINGRFTGFKFKLLAKIIKRFLDWRYDVKADLGVTGFQKG